MQQEDDLRGLAKVMEFMRAISILLVIIHIYWFCYRSVHELNMNISVVDKILLNFNRTTGLFTTILWTKLFSIVFLALSCLGTCLLYTSPSPRDRQKSRMPSSA